MSTETKLRIGVIGLAMGKAMLNVNILSNFKSRVTAICDLNEQRLQQYKEEFNVDFATSDYKAVINREDIDIIAIFTPDKLHMQMIRESLSAGKHVICTKPMVESLEDAKETVELVRKYNKKFLVGQTRRFVKHNIEAKALYDSGKIGTAMVAEANYCHGDFWTVFDRTPWRYEDPKDFLYGAACHAIDHLRWYFGDADEVFAYGNTSPIDLRYPQDKEMNFLANIKFKNGVIAKMLTAIGIVDPPDRHREGFCVYGTKGTIYDFKARYLEDGDRNKPVTVDFSRDNKVDFDGKEYSGHGVSVLSYVKELEDCILNDKKPSINELDGAKTAAISAACWESIKTGKPVKVFNEF